MRLYVLLLRGINVGGKNVLPMQDLRDILASVGCENVATYIQSGNVVCSYADSAKRLAATVAAAIEADCGFRPDVMALPANGFSRIVAKNPFSETVVEPKYLHVSFLLEPARQVQTVRLDEMLDNGEEYSLSDSALYMYAPNGIGRSKFAANAEKCLGVAATGRNWRTVCKIEAMLCARRINSSRAE